MLEVVKNVALFLVAMPVEMFYLMLGVCYTKGIKEKRFVFFLLLLASSTLSMLVIKWHLWYYIVFVFLVFFAWLAISSYTAVIIAGRGIIGMVVQRIILFSIFALRGKLNGWYKIYRELWNRRDDNRIKSITLRNISLIFLNAFIVFMNFLLIFLQNYSK